MADPQAAKRYAQAAFSLAEEAGAASFAGWRSDLNDIASVLAESGLTPVLADSRVAVDQRQAMAARALDVQPLALNLARLLIAKKRSLEARYVATAFGEMVDVREGVAHASVTTAVELTAEQVNGISSRLGQSLNKRVVTTTVVDPSIIGGVVVRIGDQLLDGSLRTRLGRLRRELKGAG
jgi:F-type H+-transporting ATPase subunit delta